MYDFRSGCCRLSSRPTVALLAALTLAMAACSSDDLVAGPGEGGGGVDGGAIDGGGLADGGVADGGSADTSGPGDASEDVGGPDGVATCGDGVCAPGENAATCPQDCGPDPFACVEESCPDELAFCTSILGCNALWSCIVGCKLDEDCQDACVGDNPGGLGAFAAVAACAEESGCVVEPPECGDGVCEDGETPASCPADCGGGGSGLQCALDNCPEQGSACLGSGGCASIVACLEAGGDDECFDDKNTAALLLFDAFFGCGEVSGCFGGPVCGNGICEGPDENPGTCPADCAGGPVCGDGFCDPELEQSPEAPFYCPSDCEGGDDSCEDKCGAPFDPNAVCQCDEACVDAGDCCPDYGALCGGGGPVCGDGVCEGAEQNPNSPVFCPPDCEQGPICGDGVCQGGENPGTCPQDCAKEPICGDGECSPGETADGCPSDCGAGPVCGDGLCAAQESPDTCPEDCGGLKPVCGNGACEPGESNASCPSDCKQDPLQCVQDKCFAQALPCLSDPVCTDVALCLSACKGDECTACIVNVPDDSLVVIEPLLDCAVASGCFGGIPKPICGNGVCESLESKASCPKDCAVPTCGNGQCEDGESNATCPADCAPVCGDGACTPPESIFTCPTDCGPTCGDGQCESSEDQFGSPFYCPADCQQGPVCGDGQCQGPEQFPQSPFYCPADCQQGTVCGNGQCEQGENGFNCPQDCQAGSCKGQCGGQSNGCFCDAVCTSAGDCCADFKEECLGGCGDGICKKDVENEQNCPQDCGKQAVCGNGQCEDGETANSCPKDCGVDPVACVQQNCGPQLGACIGNGGCVQAVTCLSGCGSADECAKCVSGISDQALVVLQPVYTCANKAGCAGALPGFSCGDGACLSPVEDADVCPADCKAGPVCGDGKCEPGEQCVKDCAKQSVGACLKLSCAKQYSACIDNPICGALVGQCLFSCDVDDPACQQGCLGPIGLVDPTLTELGACGVDAGCLSVDIGGPVCGDGVCSAPSENAFTCPADCADQPTPCNTKADCAASEICCLSSDGSKSCKTFGDCF